MEVATLDVPGTMVPTEGEPTTGVAGLDAGGRGVGCDGGGAAAATEFTRASKSALGSVALVRSKVKWSLALWYPNELEMLAGLATARALRAQANGLAPWGFRDPPSHSLQPLQRKLATQWVELT
jgi:hypothetical protein